MDSYKVKKQSSIPPWLEQNKAVIAIALTALVLIGGVLLLDMRSPPPVEMAPVVRGELAIVMGPVKTWEEGSTTRLKGVQLKIKNRGEAPAERVQVMGVFRGVPLPLVGKHLLLPGEVADYSITFNMVVLNSDSMEFKAECGNCLPVVFPAR